MRTAKRSPAPVPIIVPREDEGFISIIAEGSIAPHIPDGARLLVRVRPGIRPGETPVSWTEDGGLSIGTNPPHGGLILGALHSYAVGF